MGDGDDVDGHGWLHIFWRHEILKKARQPVQDCITQIEAKRAEDVPCVFMDIHVYFVLKGPGIKEAHVKRAVQLFVEKHCSASIMLGRAGVNITHGYEIIDSRNG